MAITGAECGHRTASVMSILLICSAKIVFDAIITSLVTGVLCSSQEDFKLCSEKEDLISSRFRTYILLFFPLIFCFWKAGGQLH